jgi:Flp pilus assembly protein TadG
VAADSKGVTGDLGMALKMGDKTGASAVEFAIILPVLILFLFGIIEFSILFYDKAVITNASREGTRAGIVYQPDPVTEGEIQQVVLDYCADHLITFGETSILDIEITTLDESKNPTPIVSPLEAGDPLRVMVEYDYQFLVLPNFVTALTGGINLAAITVMRME